MVKLYRDDDGAVSWGGKEYVVEDGAIDVPADAINELLSHGFRLAPEKPAPATPVLPALEQAQKELGAARQATGELQDQLARANADVAAAQARIKELEQAAAAKGRKG